MLKFRYWVELEKGYTPTMETEEEKELCFIIEAKNRATADRMVKSLLSESTNIVSYSGICIEEV